MSLMRLNLRYIQFIEVKCLARHMFSSESEKKLMQTQAVWRGAVCEVTVFNCSREISFEASIKFGALKQISANEHVKDKSLGRVAMCW